jgi:hypothetical protein
MVSHHQTFGIIRGSHSTRYIKARTPNRWFSKAEIAIIHNLTHGVPTAAAQGNCNTAYLRWLSSRCSGAFVFPQGMLRSFRNFAGTPVVSSGGCVYFFKFSFVLVWEVRMLPFDRLTLGYQIMWTQWWNYQPIVIFCMRKDVTKWLLPFVFFVCGNGSFCVECTRA